MKNLKLIVATCVSVAALAAPSFAHADTTSRSNASNADMHHSSRWSSTNNGCSGPASYCNTYFGN